MVDSLFLAAKLYKLQRKILNFIAQLRIRKVTALPARHELLGKAVFYRPAAAAETQRAVSGNR